MFHRARVDVENQAYDAGFSAGERTQRTRMEKILEAGEENRQADIELGRQLERDRILSLVRALESLIVKGK
jgi:hypothetical protein